MYKRTTATNKILSLTKRIRGVSGGTSASKTISILFWLIQYAQTKKNKSISVVSESLPHLRRGAIRDFLTIMKTHDYFNKKNWNATNSTYTFPKTKTIIEFFGADSSDKLKGARRDVLFINEANNVSEEAFNQLETRTRGVVWLDWNPDREFWWYTEVEPHRDVDFLILTYKDNDALGQNIIDSIESRQHNKNWWQVYGLGKLGEVEGRIYTGWNIIDEIPKEAKLDRYGMDFGYTNDPTALIAIYYLDGGFVLDEVLYRKGMHNSDIAKVIKGQPHALVVADSAEPKSIAEIARHGVAIVGATKGSGSILQGIGYVQDFKISVTKRSTNLIKEYRNYLWDTDKNSNNINVPQGFNDHALDAVRYAIQRAINLENKYKKAPPKMKQFQGQTILDNLMEDNYEFF